MKLKTKSLINITISTALVFFLSGYFTFNYFENILKQQIIKDIENDSKKIQNFLSNIEKNQLEVINSIEDDDKILSILNLISNYEDKTYYSDFIFNTEKESLIQYSQKFAKDGENILIEFFDKDNSLIAKKSFNKRVDESVYVIYDDGNAFIKNLKDKTLTPLENKINKCLGTNYNYINNYYTICHKKELKQDSSISLLDKQTQENANIAAQSHEVAVTTDFISNLIVKNANAKEFDGKDDVKAKNIGRNFIEDR